MRHLKQWTTALLALLLALTMTAGAPAEAQPAPAELFGSPWYNITVIGNLPDSAAEAKDDLYSYYNYDVAAAHQDAAASVILGGNEEIRAVLKDALADEFYETFNVKEGDNMYIAPESRLRIWGADANP